MRTVEETIEVAVPLRTAYDQWTQFKSFPRFWTGVRSVEHVGPCVTAWVIGRGPLRRRFQIEIVEQEPDSHLVWRSLERRPFLEGEVGFRPVTADRTAVTVRLTARPHGTCALLTHVPVLGGRLLRDRLQHFKEFIEGLGEAGGAWRGHISDGRVRPVEARPPRSRVPTWPVG